MGALVEVGDFSDFGIFPETFEAVEVARLTLKDMDEEVSIVDGYPLPVLQPYYALPMLTELVLDKVDKFVGNAQHVGGRGAFADHEVLECGFVKLAHVDDADVARLAVLKTFDDDFYKFVCHST